MQVCKYVLKAAIVTVVWDKFGPGLPPDAGHHDIQCWLLRGHSDGPDNGSFLLLQMAAVLV